MSLALLANREQLPHFVRREDQYLNRSPPLQTTCRQRYCLARLVSDCDHGQSGVPKVRPWHQRSWVRHVHHVYDRSSRCRDELWPSWSPRAATLSKHQSIDQRRRATSSTTRYQQCHLKSDRNGSMNSHFHQYATASHQRMPPHHDLLLARVVTRLQ